MVSISAECQPLYRPRYLPIISRYVDHHLADISVDTSVNTSTDIPRSLYRPRVGRWHIGRVSGNMSTDTLVECWLICWPMYRLKGAQNTHDLTNVLKMKISTLFILTLDLYQDNNAYIFYPVQAQVVEKVDNAIHWIKHYPSGPSCSKAG